MHRQTNRQRAKAKQLWAVQSCSLSEKQILITARSRVTKISVSSVGHISCIVLYFMSVCQKNPKNSLQQQQEPVSSLPPPPRISAPADVAENCNCVSHFLSFSFHYFNSCRPLYLSLLMCEIRICRWRIVVARLRPNWEKRSRLPL